MLDKSDSQDISYSDSGFSVIEVLVTLIVVSFLFAGIFGFVGQLNTINRLAQSVSEQSQLLFLESYLKNRIQSAKAVPIFNEGILNHKYFVGDNSGFKFVAEVRRGALGTGLFDVSIEWDSQSALISERYSYRRLDQNSNDNAFMYPVFDHIKQLTLKYGSHLSADGKIVWFDDWNKGKSFPTSVHMTGTYIKNGGEHKFGFFFTFD